MAQILPAAGFPVRYRGKKRRLPGTMKARGMATWRFSSLRGGDVSRHAWKYCNKAG